MFEVVARIKNNNSLVGYILKFSCEEVTGYIRVTRRGLHDLAEMGIIHNVKCSGTRFGVTGINGFELRKLPDKSLAVVEQEETSKNYIDKIYIIQAPNGKNRVTVKRFRDSVETDYVLGVI